LFYIFVKLFLRTIILSIKLLITENTTRQNLEFGTSKFYNLKNRSLYCCRTILKYLIQNKFQEFGFQVYLKIYKIRTNLFFNEKMRRNMVDESSLSI